MKNKILIYSLVIITMVLILFNSCKKDKIPELTTTNVGNITATTATSGGTITSDGNESISAYGVCWSTGQEPTISDSKSIDGTGSGSFISTISGLSPGTTYFLRAYATNSTGTGYGNIVSFTTNTGNDIIPPVITLIGSDMKVSQFSGPFTDPGAIAIDNNDGMVNVVSSGVVNTTSAGDYVITYTATDSAGNVASKTRTVNVSGSDYLAGSYTVEDYTGSTSNGTYSETITASTATNNRINFTKFAFYTNGAVYGTVSGTTITIPQQTVNCGSPSASRTFSGSATYTNNLISFTLNYTETTNGTTYICYGVYNRN
jgi:hypothetical protein